MILQSKTVGRRKINLVADFASVDEMLEHLEKADSVVASNGKTASERIAHLVKTAGNTSQNWIGISGIRESNFLGDVAKIQREGWPDGVRRMLDAMENIEAPPAKSVRRRAVWSDDGHEVDMDRIRSGNLDTAWRRVRKSEVSGPKRVHIVTNLSMSSATNHDVLFWKGAAAVKLADILTEAGYAVKLSAYMVGSNEQTGDDVETYRVVVKDYTAPLDLNSVAASMCLPAAFRVTGFALKLACSNHRIPYNYGYSFQLNDDTGFADEGETLLIAPNAGHSLQGRNTEQAYGRHEANRWVIEQIAKLDSAVTSDAA